MKFQAFHVNPGEKLKKKDVNNNLSNFMSVFPTEYIQFLALKISSRKSKAITDVDPELQNATLEKDWEQKIC